MGMLVDICGVPIDLEKVKDFRVIKRDYIFCPYFEEMVEERRHLFGFSSAGSSFLYIRKKPFGMILNEKEKPTLNRDGVVTFRDSAGLFALDGLSNTIGNLGVMAADLLRIDTHNNTKYRVVTPGGVTRTIRLRDIPARVRFMNGRETDVYKNDPNYAQLDDTISPSIEQVDVLTVQTEKESLVFFGSGINMDDPYTVYRALLEHHNALEAAREAAALEQKAQSRKRAPVLALPKLDLSSIKLQSPITFVKKDKPAEPEEETPPDTETDV